MNDAHYNLLKILHIVSGSLTFSAILGSQAYWLYLSLGQNQHSEKTKSEWRKQFMAAVREFIAPGIFLGALIQIGSGFTLISWHQVPWTALWVRGALIGILALLINWGLFMGLLAYQTHKAKYYAAISLALSTGILSTMIYFMANRTL